VNISRRTTLTVCFLTISLISGLAFGATATQATVLTHLGSVVDGTISGLAPIIQLRAPDEITVIGPMQQYDIPVSLIRQISFDFPRLVIETETAVVIGPYSAFIGIDEVLSLLTDAQILIEIPVTSLRAIALHGTGLQPVPREWLGDRYLSMPEIVSASPLIIGDWETVEAEITPPSSNDSTPIWDAITPETPLEESGDLPWWLGVLGVAALVILFYLLSSGQST